MAQINHNSYLDTIAELFTDAKSKEIMHLVMDNDSQIGEKFKIKNKELINFATCGYLALEVDNRLKKGAIEMIERYGTQLSLSRGFLSSSEIVNLEALLNKMYNYPVMVQSSTSTCHISNIVSLVREKDAIILDQQVHMSVQTACQLLRQKGVPVEMIRHSNLEMLEAKIKELGDKYKKIWYMVDGVYSMFGDVAPINEIVTLMNKYEQLYLYVDDAHGMSWCGKNGTGFIFNEVGMHDKMILVTTLAKGFGATGGITIFPNEKMCEKVRIFGGPYCYSHPLSPATLGAAIASAEIHLSDEIYQLQAELKNRTEYCNSLLQNSIIPVVSNPITPIYLIGAGQPKVGQKLVKALMNEGLYVNIATFPAVPAKCSGLRFTITRHQSLENIKHLVDALLYHYPIIIKEENYTVEKVRKLFKLPNKEELVNENDGAFYEIVKDKLVNGYYVQYEDSINNISKKEWDDLFDKNGSYDWNGLKFLEESFSGNPKIEENWRFHYFIIRNKQKTPLLATFFTTALLKDDMLTPETISMQIEEKRKKDNYYLTSTTLAMGSLLTEGKHLFLDKRYKKWRDVFSVLLDEASKLQEKERASMLLLRDFEATEEEIKSFLFDHGFVKIDMPNTNIIENNRWSSKQDFLDRLSSRNRRHVRKDVFDFEHYFDVEIKNELSESEIDYFYSLYKNVHSRNLSFNEFPYPRKIVEKMSQFDNWEFIVLKLKSEYDDRQERMPVGVLFCYKSPSHYSPMLVGMDYNYIYKYNVYRQCIYQVVKRANELGLERIHFGLSADTEKRKCGAYQIPTVAYIQTKDNFSFELLESMASIEIRNAG